MEKILGEEGVKVLIQQIRALNLEINALKDRLTKLENAE